MKLNIMKRIGYLKKEYLDLPNKNCDER